MKDETIIVLLKKNLDSFEKALLRLKKAQIRAQAIFDKPEYNDDDFEIYESLTSRFARATDIATQKVLRNLFLILEERPDTFIDFANLAEKLGLANAETLVQIRRLRNRIAHDYDDDGLSNIISGVLEYLDNLYLISDNIQQFIIKRDLL